MPQLLQELRDAFAGHVAARPIDRSIRRHVGERYQSYRQLELKRLHQVASAERPAHPWLAIAKGAFRE